jgi:hypothetical protein
MSRPSGKCWLVTRLFVAPLLAASVTGGNAADTLPESPSAYLTPISPTAQPTVKQSFFVLGGPTVVDGYLEYDHIQPH